MFQAVYRPDGIFFHGDDRYIRTPLFEVLLQGADRNHNQMAFNEAIECSRIAVEWMCNGKKIYWTSVGFKEKLRTQEFCTGLLYEATVLVAGFRCCVCANEMSHDLECPPPMLLKYVGLEEDEN